MTAFVKIKELDQMVYKALRNIGYSDDDAKIMTRVMMHAEIHGNNQGISKLYRPQDMGFNPKAGPLKFENETPQSVVVNGNQRSGMVALSTAVDKVVAKARATKFAIAGTYNTYTSTGMLAFYASTVAEAGLIAIVMAGSPEMVAPVGGKQAVFGTNPICFAIPDPSLALEGAFLAFGGYKGAGLALVVELLTQVLSGGAIPGGGGPEAHVGTGRKWREKSWSNTVIAIDPALLMAPDRFKARVQEVCTHVKNSGPRVTLPGELEIRRRDENLQAGGLHIAKGLFDNIQALANTKAKL